MASLLLVAATLLNAPPSLDEFFADFVAKREHIQTLEAQFIQENKSPDETVRSAGRIVFAKPKQLLFEYFDPKIIYAIDGQRVYEYQSELEQVQVYDVENSAQADAFFIAFDNKADRLRDAYDIALEDATAADCGNRILKLQPKKRSAADSSEAPPLYREIRMYLRKDDLLPCRIVAINEEGAEVAIEIKDYKINSNPPALVQFQVPEGTKIIENEEKFGTVGAGGKIIPDKKPATEPKQDQK